MAVKLYSAGETHAHSLIDKGEVDESSPWSFSTEDGDKILGDGNDWTAYASWHLGEVGGADTQTRYAWEYPFGKEGKVYRAALRAIASRAAQNGAKEISIAASHMIDRLDAQKAEARHRDGYRRWRDGPGRFVAVREWYRFIGQAPGECAPDDPDCPDEFEMSIFDEIGGGFWSDGVTAKAFIEDLAKIPAKVKTIRVHVNSQGGDVFDALAIANALRLQSRDKGRMVEMSIEGLAASAATLVTSAGDRIKIADNALMMVHNPSGMAMGTAEDMRATADALDRVRGAIIATYSWVSKLGAKALGALMDATTWMSAEEAVANGFAGEIVLGTRATASFGSESLSALGQVPEQYRARVDALVLRPAADPSPPAPAPAPAPVIIAAASAAEVLGLCRAAECLDLAEPLLAAKATLEIVTARTDRAREIRALCGAAKLPEMASGYITADAPVDVVRAQLTTVSAKLDSVEIDAHLRPPDLSRDQAVLADLNPTTIYAKRNAPATVAKGA